MLQLIKRFVAMANAKQVETGSSVLTGMNHMLAAQKANPKLEENTNEPREELRTSVCISCKKRFNCLCDDCWRRRLCNTCYRYPCECNKSNADVDMPESDFVVHGETEEEDEDEEEEDGDADDDVFATPPTQQNSDEALTEKY